MVNGSDVKISELQNAGWAGNTNNLILVENNDIYVKYEINHQEVRITKTGVPGIIYNGIPDWLYQGTSIQTSIRESLLSSQRYLAMRCFFRGNFHRCRESVLGIGRW